MNTRHAFRTLSLALALLAGFSPAPGAKPMASSELGNMSSAITKARIDNVLKLIQAKQYDRALSEVRALQKEFPTDPTPWNLEGAIAIERNDLAAARTSFERALALRPDSAATATNLAQLDMKEGNADAASKRYKGVLERDPTDVNAMMGLAALAMVRADEKEYVSWLQRAIAQDPARAGPKLLLADYLINKRDTAKAMELTQGVLATNPNDVKALDLLGRAQQVAGDNVAATTTYTKLAQVAPKDPLAHFRLASAQFAGNDVVGARRSLARALALKPDMSAAKLLLGTIEINAAHWSDAARLAREVQQAEPKSVAAVSLEGDALMGQKDYPAAVKAYDRAFALQPTGPSLVKQSNALAAAGRGEEGRQNLVRWVTNNPNDLVVRSGLAQTYMASSQNKPAIEQLQQVVQSDPKNVNALNDLAWLYYLEKDPKALATAQAANRLDDRNAHVQDTLGWILVDQGQVDQGLPLLRKAAETLRQSGTVRYHYASALARSGNKALARRELEALLKENPNFSQRADAESLLRQL